MNLHDLEFKAEEVANLRGDDAKAGFINCFKEVQRYKTQLNQYTDLAATGSDESNVVNEPMPSYGFTDTDLAAFRGPIWIWQRNFGTDGRKEMMTFLIR